MGGLHRSRICRSTTWRLIVVLLCAAACAAHATTAAADTTNQRGSAPAGCSYATPGTGPYATSLCWLDMSSFDPVQASTPQGQTMTTTFPGGYTLTYQMHLAGSTPTAVAFPTWYGAYLGTGGRYMDVGGKPAFYNWGPITLTLDDVRLVGPSGGQTGFALVGADAESTDWGESMTWNADVPMNLIAPRGNICDGGLTGVGTTTVSCSGSSYAGRTSTLILAADDPTTFSVSWIGQEAAAFGVLISTVQLSVQMAGRVDPSDAATVAVSTTGGTQLVGGTSGAGSTGSTGLFSFLTTDLGSALTFGEDMSPGVMANYDASWACTRNGSADPSLPSGMVGTSADVHVGVGDFVDCTITDTPRSHSLSVQAAAGPPDDADGDGVTDAGDTIPYSFTVTNTGQLALDNIALSAPAAGAVSCPQPSLATGASEVCTADHPYTVSVADETAGSVQISATATGTAPGTSQLTTSPPSSVSTPITTPQPAVSVVKTAAASGGTGPLDLGETIAYSYVVTNTGNVRLVSVAVSDPTLGAVTCPAIGATGLDPGGSVTCTADDHYTVTPVDIAHGSVSDTATATGTDPDGGGSPPSAPSTVVVQAVAAAPRVAVSASATVTPAGDQGAAVAGDSLAYTFIVTNIGNVDLSSVAVDVPGVGRVTCPSPGPGGLGVGASITCTADVPYTVTQRDVDAGGVTGTATATGVGQAGGTSPGSAPATVTTPTVAAAPAVSVRTLATVTPAADAGGVRVGDSISFTYVVTNTGNVTLDSVAVDDPSRTVRCPAPAPPGLAPGASLTCAAAGPHGVTRAEADSGAVTEVATAVGHGVRGGTSAPSARSVVVTPAEAIAALSVRTADVSDREGSPVSLGDTIQFGYEVTNIGTVPLTGVTVHDAVAGAVTCPPTPPPGLMPLQTLVCTADARYRVTQADVDAGRVIHTATALGTSVAGAAVSAPVTGAMPAAVPTPRVALAKTATVIGRRRASSAWPGQRIAYSFLVTNVGTAGLRSVVVSDPRQGHVTCPHLAAPLEPGHSVTCRADSAHRVTASDVHAGRVVNTATAFGISTTGVTSRRSRPATAILTAIGAPPHRGRGAPIQTIQTDLGRSIRRASSSGLAVAWAALLAVVTALTVQRTRKPRR